MSLPARQPTVLADIAPFNPPGTHPPGTLPAHLFPTGSAPVNPSYPIRPPEPTDQPTAPPPAYPSPQQVVDAALQHDRAYQRIFRGESFIYACPKAPPEHASMCEDGSELISALQEEPEEQEVKAALRVVGARYQAELEASRQSGALRFRPTTTLIRLLFLVAAENPHTVTSLHLNSLGEQYRDQQEASINSDHNILEDDNNAIERERIIQKILQYEALLEKHPDYVTLVGSSTQDQFGKLVTIDECWEDEAAAPLVRAMAEMYRTASIQSLDTRVTPISTMLRVIKSVEEQQTDPIAKLRAALMAKMFLTTTESVLDLTQALNRAPYNKQELQQGPLSPAPTVPAPAVTTQPRHSTVPALNLSGIHPQFGGLQSPAHLISPLSTGASTLYDSASSQYGKPTYPPTPQLSSMHNTMHGQPVAQLQPQPSMNTLHSATQPAVISKDDPVPPYPGEPVPPLTRQPKVKFGPEGALKSKDLMLNTDGDALYRFLLDHLDAPTFRLHCYGSHIVTDIVANGKEVKTKERTVVDFDFVIDLALSMQRGPGEFYILDDTTWAYRGAMYKQMGKPTLPNSVQAWARDYATSPKTGKEFRFRKVVHGLDRDKTLDAINQIINSTGHSTYRKVYFSVTKGTIQVRADSALMTMLRNSFITCLLWLVCVWPIIWLIRRFGKNGGKWDVCRASYLCHRDPRDPPGTDGVPLEDGDWVKIWERTLRLAVGNRIQTSSPIYRPTANDSGVILFD